MYNFYLTQKPVLSELSACIVIAIADNHKLTPSAQIVDDTLNNIISLLIQRGSISGKLGHITSIPLIDNHQTEHLLIIGAGQDKNRTESDYRKIIHTANKELLKISVKEASFYLTELDVCGRNENWKVRRQVEAMAEHSYPINSLKSEPDEQYHLKKITIYTTNACEDAVLQGTAIALGVKRCKDLSNLPSNICTPTYLAQHAQELAKQHQNLSTVVLDEAEIKQLGMNTMLSVGAGSAQPCKLVVMNYRGGLAGEKPHALLGKGISFDTGGICLKNKKGMLRMKYDMCGSAAVIGAIVAAIELSLPLNIIGVIGCAENMPGSQATKPSDIVTSMSGKTIEILNTDAEGRLILCDMLTYIEQFNPDSVVDVATLTGACVTALGVHYSGLFSNDEALAKKLLDAGHEAMDKAWQLPLIPDEMKQLDSNFADLTNMGNGTAGAVVAALFLSRFAEHYPWAHLDVSGSAKQNNPTNEATGRPVSLLVQYLINLCTSM